MGPGLSLLILGVLFLVNEGLGQKGAFEQILDVNSGKGWPTTMVFYCFGLQ